MGRRERGDKVFPVPLAKGNAILRDDETKVKKRRTRSLSIQIYSWFFPKLLEREYVSYDRKLRRE